MPVPARLLFVLVFGLLLAGCGEDSSPARDANQEANAVQDTSETPSSLETPLLSRADFELKNYRGDVVLLNFWATWCAPCRAEMPDLKEIQKQYREDGLQIIGVSVDKGGKKDVVPYLKRQPVNYPIVLDPESKIGDRYGGVAALPTTLLIGRDGTVRRRIVGRVRFEQLREQLQGILGETPPADSATAAATL